MLKDNTGKMQTMPTNQHASILELPAAHAETRLAPITWDRWEAPGPSCFSVVQLVTTSRTSSAIWPFKTQIQSATGFGHAERT